MKRLISLALVLVMVLALGTAAFAADPTVTPETVTLKKTYTLTGGAAAPVEELSFTVAPVSGVEGGSTGSLVVGTNNKVTTSGEADTTFNMTFPTYSKVGVYKYTVTEVAGSTLGVTYDPAPITVVVTVTNASTSDTEDALEATVAIHKSAADATSQDNKIDSPKDAAFTNTYGLGQLTVTKQVSGNLASNTKKFTIHVTFTGENAKSDITYTVVGGTEQTLSLASGSANLDVELSNTESAVFTNIPAGVTYTVEEDAKHAAGADHPETTEEGYTVTYTKSDEEGKIAAGDTDTVTVKNEKKTEVDMGITLDSLPYILIALVAVIAIAVVVIRKRRVEE